MKKVIFTLAIIGIVSLSGIKTFAQSTLNDQQYSYITMDLQGILQLTMTTSSEVDFVFSTIQQYEQGIRKYNAVQLQVDATVAWDLYAFANTDTWIQDESYSSTGSPVIPAEILQVQAVCNDGSAANHLCTGSSIGINQTFDNENNMYGISQAGNPTLTQPNNTFTEFIAGVGGLTGAGNSYPPGTAKKNPGTNQFRLHLRLHPGIPADFHYALQANTGINGQMAITDPITGLPSFAHAGYYYLEVVYCLVEDL